MWSCYDMSISARWTFCSVLKALLPMSIRISIARSLMRLATFAALCLAGEVIADSETELSSGEAGE